MICVYSWPPDIYLFINPRFSKGRDELLYPIVWHGCYYTYPWPELDAGVSKISPVWLLWYASFKLTKELKEQAFVSYANEIAITVFTGFIHIIHVLVWTVITIHGKRNHGQIRHNNTMLDIAMSDMSSYFQWRNTMNIWHWWVSLCSTPTRDMSEYRLFIDCEYRLWSEPERCYRIHCFATSTGTVKFDLELPEIYQDTTVESTMLKSVIQFQYIQGKLLMRNRHLTSNANYIKGLGIFLASAKMRSAQEMFCACVFAFDWFDLLETSDEREYYVHKASILFACSHPTSSLWCWK